MTPALTLLIASSAGWAAPEMRPTRLEVELLVAAVESAVISDTLAASPVELSEPPAARIALSPSSLPSPLPLFHDFRGILRYDLALPWVRTKP